MENIQQHLEQFRSLLAEASIDLFVVSWQENRYYLSGFSARDTAWNELSGFLLIDSQRQMLFTDGRYIFQAREECPLYEVGLYTDDPFKTMAGAIRECGPKRVGIERQHLILDYYQKFCHELEGIEVVPVDTMTEKLRVTKEEWEIEKIRTSIACTEQALARTVPRLKPGLTEKEVAWWIEEAIREGGAEAVSFDLIVASGPNAAKAHHEPSSRRLREGESIVIDIGSRLDGYCSDMTRTLILGDPPDKLKEIYTVVRRAQLKAINGIRPGMSTAEADALARNEIERAGYGEYFLHSLGHGVGLAVHEEPRLRRIKPVELKENMVVTVEPGIYLEGFGGVRLEEMIVVRREGAELLNKDETFYSFDENLA